MSDPDLKWFVIPSVVIMLAVALMFVFDTWQDSRVRIACIEAGGEVALDDSDAVCIR